MTDDRARWPDDDVPPPSGDRPVLVEMAAALLIVTGAIQFASAVGVVLTGNLESGDEGVLALAIALNIGTIVAGLLTRVGRLWLLVVNYVAVLGFLDLIRSPGSAVALVLAIVDLVVLYVLFTNRPWFQRPREDAPSDDVTP
jgi:hypothetical protein